MPLPLTGRLLRPLGSALLLLACHHAAAADAAAPAPDPVPAPAAAMPPPAAFFDAAAMSGAKLSPDGRYLALRTAAPGARALLAVVDLATLERRAVAQFSDFDVAEFEWVNPRRLVFNTRDWSRPPGEPELNRGLYAVDRDGAKLRVLTEDRHAPPPGPLVKRHLQPAHTYLLGQAGAQDSDRIYVRRAAFNDNTGDFSHWELVQLDTVSGAASRLPRPGPVGEWLLDQDGAPRLALTRRDGRSAVHYLDPAKDSWRQLAEFPTYAGAADGYAPLGFGSGGKLYVRADAGRDKSAVYALDPASGKLAAAPLLSLPDYDFDGALVLRQGRLLGLRVLSDAPSMVWLDPDMQAQQRRVDALLPNTVNLVSTAAQADSPWLLVESYSDIQPASFLLFERASGKLSLLGHSRPAIAPARMAPRQLLRYPARDGLSIPVWLTLPPGAAKPLPTVLLVHDGPQRRGADWGWHAEAQFLASRGYAVLQPEYRGGLGFGSRHFRAGARQWGLAMQDDLADGARWAVAQGIADPGRICLAGAGYGGYATLMGLAKEPALFRCGVAWAAITDIGQLYSGRHGVLADTSDDWQRYAMPELVGDPVKDAAQFQATSPLAQAARIKQPLLLAYSAADRRVPLAEGEAFYAAVKAANPQVDWLRYDGEQDDWALARTRIDFWGRVERFLAKHIGPR